MTASTDSTDLDCEGLLCPLPVLKAARRLRQMAPGDTLTLRATDPMAAVDLPHYCNDAGHTLMQTSTHGPVTIFVIRRGPLSRKSG